MRAPAIALAIGVAVGVLFAGGVLVVANFPPKAWSVEQLLVPAGTVLKLPGYSGVTFAVPSGGGVVVGAAQVSGWAVLEVGPAHGAWDPGCCCEPPNGTSAYIPWEYSVNETRGPGEYFWGSVCPFVYLVNVTVTQPIEVLYP